MQKEEGLKFSHIVNEVAVSHDIDFAQLHMRLEMWEAKKKFDFGGGGRGGEPASSASLPPPLSPWSSYTFASLGKEGCLVVRVVYRFVKGKGGDIEAKKFISCFVFVARMNLPLILMLLMHLAQ